MNDLRTFIYLNDHTLNYRLRNKVPNKEWVLPVEFLSVPGLPQPQVMTRASLSGGRVGPAGLNPQSPVRQLAGTRPRDPHPASRDSLLSDSVSPGIDRVEGN